MGGFESRAEWKFDADELEAEWGHRQFTVVASGLKCTLNGKARTSLCATLSMRWRSKRLITWEIRVLGRGGEDDQIAEVDVNLGEGAEEGEVRRAIQEAAMHEVEFKLSALTRVIEDMRANP